MNEEKYIIYEQPVAENIRNFLKCEYIYEKYYSSFLKQDLWDIKSCLASIIEISDFTLRINLKVELLKELEKTILFLNFLKDSNLISLSVFDENITNVRNSINELNEIQSNPSKTVVDNDFLMLIKSKLQLPAGDNFFDMPSYLNFLSSQKSFIINSIEGWFAPFNSLCNASKIILKIKRKNANFTTFTSQKSYFELKLDKNDKIDLLRLKLNNNINIFPDVSVNRQNINIIFKTAYGNNRLSKAIDKNLEFELAISKII